MYRPPQSPAGLVTLGDWNQQSRDGQPPPPRYGSQFAPAQQWNQGYSASNFSQFGDQAHQPLITQQPWHHVQLPPSQFYSENFSNQPLAPAPQPFQHSFVDLPAALPGSGNSIPGHQQFAPSRPEQSSDSFVNRGQHPYDNDREVVPA